MGRCGPDMIDQWVMDGEFHAEETAEFLPLFHQTWSDGCNIQDLSTIEIARDESLGKFWERPGIVGLGPMESLMVMYRIKI